MKILYLAAGYGKLGFPGVTYQDKFIKRDLGGDMLEIDLNGYDLLLASPPCNFWSRASGSCSPSVYALETKHLLPGVLEKFVKSGKPFIVENVINKKRMGDIILKFPGFYYEIGRHSYFSNFMFDFSRFRFEPGNIKTIPVLERQGAGGVNLVFERFCEMFL